MVARRRLDSSVKRDSWRPCTCSVRQIRRRPLLFRSPDPPCGFRFRVFRRRPSHRGPLLRGILEFVQRHNFALTQLAACNGLHEIEERLARWLLMVQDRVESPNFDLTQEFLATMLGTRRTSVTLAAGNLQESGLIEYRRGHIRILDRKAGKRRLRVLPDCPRSGRWHHRQPHPVNVKPDKRRRDQQG